MDPISLVTFAGVIVGLIALIALGVPVAIALIGSSFLGLLLTSTSGVALSSLGSTTFNATASYSLAVVPLFVMMGTLATRAGLAGDLFDITARHLRKLPGGLALAAIGTCAGFAAITGSSIATVASVGKTAIEEMRRHGYDVRLAAGAVAMAGTLGIMIPPSIILVLLGVVTGTSIGQLLIAGIVPGVVSAILYGAVAVFMAARNPALIGQHSGTSVREVEGDALPSGNGSATVKKGQAKLEPRKYLALVKVAALFGVVVVGVYGGFYTATEAGAIGALAALVLVLITRHQHGGRLRNAVSALVESARLTSSVFFIIVGGSLLTAFLVQTGAASAFASWATTLPVPGWLLVLIILLMMVPMGMFLDSISIVLVFVPIVFPVVEAVGFDPIVFGILAVKLIELGMVTPPVGMNAFVVASGVPGVNAEDVFRGVIPFFIADALFITLIMIFPEIVLFLPNTMN